MATVTLRWLLVMAWSSVGARHEVSNNQSVKYSTRLLSVLRMLNERALGRDKNLFSFTSAFIKDKATTCKNTELPLTLSDWQRPGRSTGTSLSQAGSDPHCPDKKGSFWSSRRSCCCRALPVSSAHLQQGKCSCGWHYVCHQPVHIKTQPVPPVGVKTTLTSLSFTSTHIDW